MLAKYIAACITLAVLAAAPQAALAESYLGLNLTQMNYSASVTDGVFNVATDFDIKAVSGKLGVQFHKNFSAEVRGGVGISDGDGTASVSLRDPFLDGVSVSADGKASLDEFFGVYIRGGVPIGDSVYPYLIAGYAQSKVTLNFGDFGDIASDSDADFSYGVGLDIKLSETLSGNIEYMNYYDKDGFELSGFAIGITLKF